MNPIKPPAHPIRQAIMEKAMLILALMATLIPGASQADQAAVTWPAEAQHLAGEYKDLPRYSPDLITIMANIQARFVEAPILYQKIAPLKITLPSKHSAKGRFHALMSKRHGKKAPLVVVLSGLFADLSQLEGFTAQSIYFFERQGYHIVILPTVGGAASIHDHSKALPFEMRKAGELELDLIRKAIAHIGRENIQGGVHLVGLSYGALISAVVAGLDAASERPVLTTTTSFSPPYDGQDALSALDEGLTKYAVDRSEYDDCRNILGNAGPYLQLFSRLPQSDLSPKLRDCSGWIISYLGYQPVLKTHVKALYKERQFYADRFNFGNGSSKDPFSWRSDIRFTQYAKAFSKPGQEAPREESFLPYWVGMAHRAAGKPRIRVMAAVDEILGHEFPWQDNPYHSLTKDELILLPWGGHGGFTFYSKWFEKVLTSLFPAR